MSNVPTPRLQGTDGVRGPTRPASEYPIGPLQVFLDHGVLTEGFFELYCYSHIRRLIESGVMKEGDEALIGWDSRDTEKFFVSKAISGVSKAGAMPVLLGVIPTPGVVISLVCFKAATAFMLTASHNPKDQNGIKIFMGPEGRKLLPNDDRQLSERVFETEYDHIRRVEERFHPFDAAADEKARFINFHLDERNTWLKQGDPLFSRTILVVDPAHGALAGIAAMVCAQLGFLKVVETASEQNGNVNRNSGVAFLEGIREVTGKEFDAGGAVSLHQGVKRIFEEGRAASGSDIPVMGAVFDADGDRFYLLYYDGESDAVHVLSGDEALAIQAQHLMRSEPEKYSGRHLAFTVESDINLASHARKLGYAPLVTAVGDKWILQRANEKPAMFGIGGEETGHSIHQGTVSIACGEEKQVFAGNGLKGAINTLVAAHRLAEGKSAAEMGAMLKEPFEPGFKESFYSFHVDRKLFYRGSRVWKGVEDVIHGMFLDLAKNNLTIESEEIAEEPDMLYLRILRAGEEHLGTVFVRNSGTEEKVSVNTRGPASMERLLKEIGGRAVAYLMKNMKGKGGPVVAAEMMVLEQLFRGEQPRKEFFPLIDYDRLIFEMEIKEKLVARKEEKLTLTLLGRQLVE